ncbi:MAG: hypothetical protein MR913_01080 [Clostridiales bacterium]|nr:hypothetical protein [Clostridiales bacterium]MCI7018402.1 hypothetical protein [Clostridiales bacterium]
MVHAPFWLVFSYSILFFGGFFKCAILLTLQGQHRSGNFGQAHLGNVAGSRAQGVERLQGIETADIAEILWGKMCRRVNTAAHQKHIADAVLQQGLKNGFQRFLVQRFQEATFLIINELRQIVLEVVLHDIGCCGNQSIAQRIRIAQNTKAVFQRFHDCLFLLRANCPDGNRARMPPLMGIGNVEVVFDSRLPVAVAVQNGNALGAAIDPPPEPLVPALPPFYRQNSSGIRPLSIQQDLPIKG